MSKGGATTIVFVTGGLLVAIALLQKGSLGSGKTFKKIWGAGLLTAGLAVFADFVPELVGPFAVLVILAAVANDTGVIGKLIGNPGAVAASGANAAGNAAATATSAIKL